MAANYRQPGWGGHCGPGRVEPGHDRTALLRFIGSAVADGRCPMRVLETERRDRSYISPAVGKLGVVRRSTTRSVGP